MPSLPLLLAALALAATAAAAPAQTVRGRVVESTGQPVATALVSLIDADGRTLRSGLSGASGAFLLTAPAAGRFVLRVERIGFAPQETEPLLLSAGDTVARTITVAAAPVRLEAVRAETSARCEARPQDGTALARLWAAARGALGVSAQLEVAGAFSTTGVRYVRELDAAGRRQLALRERHDFEARGTPFRPVPIQMLRRVGFALPDADESTIYFGASAATLLSEQFLLQHCFQRIVEDRARPELVGLAFEPVPGGHTVGIAGTIWIDRASAAVASLEYEFREPDRRRPQPARGFVEFASRGDGRPFISRWWIRAPLLVEDPAARTGERIRAVGQIEEGGIVAAVDGVPLPAHATLLAELGTMPGEASPARGNDPPTAAARDAAMRAAVAGDSAMRAAAARDSTTRAAAAPDSAMRAAAARESATRADAAAHDSVMRAAAVRDSAMRAAAARDSTTRAAADTMRPIPLAPLDVSVRSSWLAANGFFERRDHGGTGHFIERADIERRNFHALTEILRGISGVRVMSDDNQRRVIRFNRFTGRGRRGVLLPPVAGGNDFENWLLNLPGCQPAVYVDNQLRIDRLIRGAGGYIDDFDFIDPGQIEGIEIYVGATAPPQWQNYEGCGVIVIWRRRS